MKIKSNILIILAITLYCGIVLGSQGKTGILHTEVGSTVYACVCGESCGCGTIGKSKGKCQCGHDLEKVTVTKVDNGIAEFSHDGNTHRIPLIGKYTCACESGSGCCEIISQKPVQCGCGKEMKLVE
jgi:hypothetical protein